MNLQVLLLALAAGSVSCQGPFHAGTTSYTLYKNKWPILELFESNWTSTVQGADRSWVVVMYASWCGHCQRFAPTYVSLAKSLNDWSNVVRFAALACSHPDAEQICLDQNIVSYPTIQLFGPDGDSSVGTIYKGGDQRAKLERALLDFLSDANPITDKSISLQPVRSVDDLLAANTPGRQRKLLLFAENITNALPAEKYLGRYVILDVSGQWKNVVVRRIEAEDAANLGIRDFPSLYEIQPQDGSIQLLASNLDRQGFHDVIRVDVLQLEASKLTSPSPGGVHTTHPPRSIVLPDGVHEQDLVSGVYNSLWREVGMHSQLQARRLRTVKTHVKNMAELLPVDTHVKTWLSRLSDWLQDKETVTKDEWKKALIDLRDKDGYIPRRVIWTGCQGSTPAKRGYPCSLWTIFHTMTVAAYQHPERGITPKDVLLGMRNYITKFFGCSECSKHFGRISANVDTEVEGGKDNPSGVMWLWRTHNKVNKRLHGDPTEDPLHPKMQFPTSTRCADCHLETPSDNYKEGQWSESEVLYYLETFYGEDNVVRDSRPYTYIAPTVKSGPAGDTGDLVGTGVRPTAGLLTWFWLVSRILSD